MNNVNNGGSHLMLLKNMIHFSFLPLMMSSDLIFAPLFIELIIKYSFSTRSIQGRFNALS